MTKIKYDMRECLIYVREKWSEICKNLGIKEYYNPIHSEFDKGHFMAQRLAEEHGIPPYKAWALYHLAFYAPFEAQRMKNNKKNDIYKWMVEQKELTKKFP